MGGTPLHTCGGRRNAREAAELLIARGADVNAKDKMADTVLRHGKTPAAAELLIAHGADVNAKDENGRDTVAPAASEKRPRGGRSY